MTVAKRYQDVLPEIYLRFKLYTHLPCSPSILEPRQNYDVVTRGSNNDLATPLGSQKDYVIFIHVIQVSWPGSI